MKELIIHPGFHKSGTTALQESFAANRDRLAELGIFYPSIGAKAHHRVAWALTQKPWGWSKRGGERIPEKLWDGMVRRISSASQNTALLSSEFFSELDGEKLRKIRSDVKDRDVKALFTLRPLAKLLPSSYQQYLKYGITIEYEDWLRAILDKPGESKVSPTFWKRHSHGKVIARWVDTFGASNVTILIVNEAQPSFLFDEINKYLSLEPGTLAAENSGSNRSLTMEEIALLLELNRKFPKERVWDEYETFIRAGYIRELTDHVPPAPDKARLLTPGWAIAKANQLGMEIKEEIKSLGVKVVGEIDSLGNAQVPTGSSTYPTTIDINTVAAAMLAFDKETIQKFPLDWLQSDLYRRYRKRLVQRLKRLK